MKYSEDPQPVHNKQLEMKQIKINLTTFLNLGGSLDKFPLEFARTTYCDSNRDKEIDHIEPTDLFFRVFFKDGTSEVYAKMWIESTVEFILDQKYL